MQVLFEPNIKKSMRLLFIVKIPNQANEPVRIFAINVASLNLIAWIKHCQEIGSVFSRQEKII